MSPRSGRDPGSFDPLDCFLAVLGGNVYPDKSPELFPGNQSRGPCTVEWIKDDVIPV